MILRFRITALYAFGVPIIQISVIIMPISIYYHLICKFMAKTKNGENDTLVRLATIYLASDFSIK